MQQVMATSQYKNGIKIGGTTYKVNIKSYDTQSSVTRAGTLAKQAIESDKVDLLFASSTPETVNAVASQANTLGTPLICSNVPWESYYINLNGNPAPGKSTLKPKYSVMYFLGAEHLVECFIPMWNRIGKTNGNNHSRRGHVPERRRRQRVPRRVPPDRQGRRVHDRPVRRLHRRADELLVDDLPVQVVEGGLLHQRAAAARLRGHVEAGGAAGLQAEAGDGGQGAAVPERRLRHGQPGEQRGHRRVVGA